MEQEEATRRIATWHLGQTSERFEAPGFGPGTISSGKNDRGGASYGSYQLSSKAGTLREYLAQSKYGIEFDGLVPATPAFNKKWREIAQSDRAFGADQHDFIGHSHYQRQLRRLDGLGLHIGGRGKAVQDLLWSTSVQFRDLTPKIVSGALAEFEPGSKLQELTDHQIISSIQDYKAKHNDELFKSSPVLWGGLRKRASLEKTALLELADAEILVGTMPHAIRLSASPTGAEAIARDVELVRRQQEQLQKLGYSGINGNPLRIDGDLGPNSKHAITSFQKAHRLSVDGVIGEDTLAALEDAKHWPLLSEATHPQHKLYLQIREGIDRLPGQVHRDLKERENAAVALTIAAHVSGMRQVDHVVLGSNGVNLFAVQGQLDDPGHRRANVDLARAVARVDPRHEMPTQRFAPASPPLHASHLAASQQVAGGPAMAGP